MSRKYYLSVRYKDESRGWFELKGYKSEEGAVAAMRSVFNGEAWCPDSCRRDRARIKHPDGRISYYG